MLPCNLWAGQIIFLCLLFNRLKFIITLIFQVLSNRTETNGEVDKFTTNEIKLLYTLHWIMLDAASECEDAELEQPTGRTVDSYLHSLDSIQLFVYLLIPLIGKLRPSDFQSLKLENGRRLWESLCNFRLAWILLPSVR